MKIENVTIEGDRVRLVGGGPAVLALELALQDSAYLEFGRFPADLDETEIKDARLEREERGAGKHWAVVDEDGVTVGLVELFIADEDERWLEAGYWITEGSRGRGLATDALVAVRDWAERELQPARIDLFIHPENDASIRVAEKAGFVERGPVKTDVLFTDGQLPSGYVWPASAST